MTHTQPMFTHGEDLPLFTGQAASYSEASFTPRVHYRQLRLEDETMSKLTDEQEETVKLFKTLREINVTTLCATCKHCMKPYMEACNPHQPRHKNVMGYHPVVACAGYEQEAA
jgi:hypothetical protein